MNSNAPGGSPALDNETRGHGELAARMGIEVVDASPERAVLRMPAAGNRQPFGIAHGGAYCVLGETAASFAANLHAGAHRIAVGIELNASHHRSLADGWMRATAVALTLGRTLTVHEVSVCDDSGQLLSTIRVTNLLREREPSTR
ncbi:PaaI family thioesterase [Microbacterium sp. Root553]|uniref:PaaI family thioesterase n=1 Tax=Microbacterium sp. Root553 TaxID=1736556 RepID=UPI0006FBB656|nr:PaaI family thioesterase [Microbacterium sp. Root553]KQZ24209.1 thioesterase [Microbacterium sp. Root553]